MDLLRQASLLAAATFVSEDLTCIAAGLLVRDGQLALFVALFGCFVGIFVSDLALWLLGRVLGKRVLRWRWLARHLPADRLEKLGDWFDRRSAAAVLAARFLPGTRLPLFVAAGVLGRRGGRFVLWSFIAALLWVPLFVMSVALLGDGFVGTIHALLGPGWLTVLLAAGAVFLLFRTAALARTRAGRARLLASVSRLWRWEFWPAWLFYLPLLPWLAWLSLRYRSLTVWTAANPGIPQGGVVGESKFDILSRLPAEWVAPSVLVPAGDSAHRLEALRRDVSEKNWAFPLILKPDAGQRGAGVKLVRNFDDVTHYLREQPRPVIAQTYHPGPFEAGIFYYRLPGMETGRIFSITDKVFPRIAGDGHSTLEELIWRHPRYRMQADTFLARHARDAGRILAEGEPFTLALAGNHCQGTLFRNGTHLVTPELERTVDTIARQFPGFYFGRFDVRYSDREGFRAGRDVAVVELNGVTSESTNIYDPSWSLLTAYCTLFRQWSLVYRIGYANQQQGHAATGTPALLALVCDYYRGLRVDPLAD